MRARVPGWVQAHMAHIQLVEQGRAEKTGGLARDAADETASALEERKTAARLDFGLSVAFPLRLAFPGIGAADL